MRSLWSNFLLFTFYFLFLTFYFLLLTFYFLLLTFYLLLITCFFGEAAAGEGDEQDGGVARHETVEQGEAAEQYGHGEHPDGYVAGLGAVAGEYAEVLHPDADGAGGVRDVDEEACGGEPHERSGEPRASLHPEEGADPDGEADERVDAEEELASDAHEEVVVVEVAAHPGAHRRQYYPWHDEPRSEPSGRLGGVVAADGERDAQRVEVEAVEADESVGESGVEGEWYEQQGYRPGPEAQGDPSEDGRDEEEHEEVAQEPVRHRDRWRAAFEEVVSEYRAARGGLESVDEHAHEVAGFGEPELGAGAEEEEDVGYCAPHDEGEQDGARLRAQVAAVVGGGVGVAPAVLQVARYKEEYRHEHLCAFADAFEVIECMAARQAQREVEGHHEEEQREAHAFESPA